MPSKTGKTPASYYKSDVSVEQSTNVGFDNTARRIISGDGAKSSMSASDDNFGVQPVNDDTTSTLTVRNKSGSRIFAVDTTNSKVLLGASQVPPTLFKEMGLYDFSPTAGYHYPLIANTMHFESAYAGDNDWGNGADPATTLDVSGLTAQENAVAVYWYLENNITLDSVRYTASTDGSDNLIFHLESYDLDVSSNHGDLSGGVTHANLNSGIAVTTTNLRTGTLALNEADIDASKVVIGFVESDSTTDLTVSFNIKYHIR